MASAQDRADYPRYLLRLCELARFAQTKSRDRFDFAAQPSLNQALVVELARCEWIDKRHNGIALGPSGTGKTAAALALGGATAISCRGGLAACQRGHSVAFTTAAARVHERIAAGDERRLRARQKHINTGKLPIGDQLGYGPFTAVGSQLLFALFSQLCARRHVGHPQFAMR
jgi:DNA replication protein DnaC